MSSSETSKTIKIDSLTQKNDVFSNGIFQRGIIFNDMLTEYKHMERDNHYGLLVSWRSYIYFGIRHLFPVLENSSAKIHVDCQWQSRHWTLKSRCWFRLCCEENWSSCFWHNEEQLSNTCWRGTSWETGSKLVLVPHFTQWVQESKRQIDLLSTFPIEKIKCESERTRPTLLCILCAACCLVLWRRDNGQPHSTLKQDDRQPHWPVLGMMGIASSCGNWKLCR